MAESIVTVELNHAGGYRRRPCLFCGGSSDKNLVNAQVSSAVVNRGPAQKYAGPTGDIVCETCLGLDKAALVAEIQVNAAWHRERAADLDAIAANLPPLPSRQQWEAANELAERQDPYDDEMPW